MLPIARIKAQTSAAAARKDESMKVRFALFLLLVFPSSLSHAASPFSSAQAELLQDGLSRTADDFILPSYRGYSEAVTDLTKSIKSYCTGTGDLKPVHSAFEKSYLAWQKASIIQVGPVMDADGLLRFQLWPDPKGFSRRAIKKAQRAEKPSLLAKGGLEKASIALTNLNSLELLLYGRLEPQSYGCDLSVAISRHQSELAGMLVAEWTGGAAYRHAFDSAKDGNDRYESVDQLIRELLAGIVVHADRLRKFKIQRGLGLEAGKTYPKRTEARKSGLGLASIRAGFRALSDLYGVPYGFFDVTPDIGGPMDYYTLGDTAGGVADALGLETRSLVEIAEEDGALAQKLRGFGDLTLRHETYLKTSLSDAIGLSMGFTSVDGD